MPDRYNGGRIALIAAILGIVAGDLVSYFFLEGYFVGNAILRILASGAIGGGGIGFVVGLVVIVLNWIDEGRRFEKPPYRR